MYTLESLQNVSLVSIQDDTQTKSGLYAITYLDKGLKFTIPSKYKQHLQGVLVYFKDNWWSMSRFEIFKRKKTEVTFVERAPFQKHETKQDAIRVITDERLFIPESLLRFIYTRGMFSEEVQLFADLMSLHVIRCVHLLFHPQIALVQASDSSGRQLQFLFAKCKSHGDVCIGNVRQWGIASLLKAEFVASITDNDQDRGKGMYIIPNCFFTDQKYLPSFGYPGKLFVTLPYDTDDSLDLPVKKYWIDFKQPFNPNTQLHVHP